MTLAEMWQLFWGMVSGIAVVHFFPRQDLWEHLAIAFAIVGLLSLALLVIP